MWLTLKVILITWSNILQVLIILEDITVHYHSNIYAVANILFYCDIKMKILKF